jgi:hypothetical protein
MFAPKAATLPTRWADQYFEAAGRFYRRPPPGYYSHFIPRSEYR